MSQPSEKAMRAAKAIFPIGLSEGGLQRVAWIIDREMGTTMTDFPNTVTRHTCSCRHEERQNEEHATMNRETTE